MNSAVTKSPLAAPFSPRYTSPMRLFYICSLPFLALACSAEPGDKSDDGEAGISGSEDSGSEDSSSSDSGVDSDDDIPPDEEPIREVPDDAVVTEEGTCFSEAELRAADGAVYDQVPVTSYPQGLTVSAMLSSTEDVEGFQAALGVSLDASGVNFDTHSILYAQVGSTQTCGPDEAIGHVVSIDGSAHLSLELWVPDGTCEDVCDQTWSEYAAVKVKREPGLSICSRRIDFCE